MPANNIASTLGAALSEMAAVPLSQCPFSLKPITPEEYEAAVAAEM